MPTYVAFLRAINLGPNRKFPKADIVAATEAAGGTDVLTHINTGNVRLTIGNRSPQKVAAVLEKAYEERAGFAVPTIVFTTAELRAIADDARELTRPDLERHYVYLLADEPDPDRVTAVHERSTDVNQVVVRGRAAHVLLGPGYEAGAVDPYKIEKSLDVVATNRNLNVVTTLADKWC
ncbi:uncharacterized protein (DUF1697 family) [Nocardioides sp. J9]|uniref:DUF1697 domain-containing protein n=1 Tax=unclassified Nocardioides TaxID=2615069 RepID=UPI00048C56BE|nr:MULTISPECIES: DUF1697 domain-containing protein [unclassified Nocardioides]TWG97384.1 uncharacterized protein (DUF1697 family) [Nocardioides sp. J9]